MAEQLRLDVGEPHQLTQEQEQQLREWVQEPNERDRLAYLVVLGQLTLMEMTDITKEWRDD